MTQRFSNLNKNIKSKGFLEFLKWKLNAIPPKWPSYLERESIDKPPANFHEGIRISYVGHVTFLIQVGGINIITDPFWSERASPFQFTGPRRIIGPGIEFENLPKIDIILISHNHYDHMDIPTIKKLWQRDRPKIFCPLRNFHYLKSIKGLEAKELDWGDSVSISDKMEVCLEPAQHWSARGLFDRNKALWGTFILKTSFGDICFIGDSGYEENLFKAIGDKYNIKVSLIPIGAYLPRYLMADVHFCPEEAARVHLDLKSEYSISSHFDVVQLADEAFGQAPNDLKDALRQYNINEENFIIPKVGNFFEF